MIAAFTVFQQNIGQWPVDSVQQKHSYSTQQPSEKQKRSVFLASIGSISITTVLVSGTARVSVDVSQDVRQ